MSTTIKTIKQHRVDPFEIEDVSLKKLFSFFLHNAPSIKSAGAANVPLDRLDKNWNAFINERKLTSYKFYSPNTSKEAYFQKALLDCKLNDSSVINKNAHAFVCWREKADEAEYACLLRHLRNAIAHGHTCFIPSGNRKYTLFEDYNISHKQTASILFSETDLKKLKQLIMR